MNVKNIMINYKFEEEKIVALYLADLMEDHKAKELLERGSVSNSEEATYLSKFFWKMMELSEEENRPVWAYLAREMHNSGQRSSIIPSAVIWKALAMRSSGTGRLIKRRDKDICGQ
ncbi:MAG: hypothetical protein OEZ39_13405 [Gammaproteobacteria bacterium]|nr:hypothetical protein [Gammaproteobacteria bacterium]MDH5652847.1 hypothetical protein [Gammaproteobacteria bacterium]